MGTVQSSSCTSSASASVCSSPRNNNIYSEQQIQPTLDETINRILKLVGRKPMRNNYGMQRAVQLLARATSEEKEQMLQRGVLRRICLLINEHCNIDLPPPPSPIFNPVQQQHLQRHSISCIENNNLIDKKEQKIQINEETEEIRESRKKIIVGNNKSGKVGNRRSSTQQAKGTTIKDGNKKAAARKRPGSAESVKAKGVGYGRGSTKSRWNLERTVEERSLQEEHLIWLLSALISYLWGDRLLERVCDWELTLNYKGGERRRSAPSMFYGEMPSHLEDEILAEQILQSAVIPLLVFHLNNDSVLDVSQHIKLYQVIFELTAGLAGIPAILPHLVKQQEKTNGKSIAKELIPRFRDNMNNYPMLVRGITETDITFMDFIRKVNDFSEVILRMSREYERQIPTEKRIKTSCAPRYLSKARLNGQQNIAPFHLRRRSFIPNNLNNTKTTNIQRNSNSFANIDEIVKLNNNENSEELSLPSSPLYQSASLIGEGILIKSDRGDFRLKSSKGISRPMTRQMDRDEIARIDKQSYIQQYKELLRELQISTWKLLNDAGKPVYGYTFKKELRSVNPFSPTHKDRTKRIAKELSSMHNSLPLNASNAIFVLISGPDDTPYQNGLFEFDVFFPVNYPQQPPKCSFLTTGAGNVRFNPNLYNDGKICLSILGTWEGRPEEKWNPLCSLLQVLISIQGLIFVHQPFFNEPGYEKQQGTPKGDETSRKYNLQIENATLVYAIYEQWKNGPIYFRDIIKRHFWAKRESVLKQAEKWLQSMVDEIRNNNNNLPKKSGGEDGEGGGNGIMFGGVFNSTAVQRQTVRKLVDAFRDMKNPLLEEC